MINEENYEILLGQVNSSLEQNNVLLILDKMADYYNFWQTNEVENQFYHTSDYRFISGKLSEIAKSRHLREILSHKDLYKMLPLNDLVEIAIENQDIISNEDFEMLQDRILELCQDEEKVKLAGISRADFDKIQENILKGINISSLAKLAQTYPKKTDLGRAYCRASNLMRLKYKYSKNKQEMKNSFDLLEKMYKEEKRQELEDYQEKRYARSLERS